MLRSRHISAVHRIFTENQHSPLDSANNRCYNIVRTKEGKQQNEANVLEASKTSRFQGNKVNKHTGFTKEWTQRRKGEMTYVDA